MTERDSVTTRHGDGEALLTAVIDLLDEDLTVERLTGRRDPAVRIVRVDPWWTVLSIGDGEYELLIDKTYGPEPVAGLGAPEVAAERINRMLAPVGAA